MDAMKQFPWNNIIAEVMDDVYVHYHDEKVLDNFKMGKPKVTTGEIQKFLQDNPTSLLIQADEEDVDAIRRTSWPCACRSCRSPRMGFALGPCH